MNKTWYRNSSGQMLMIGVLLFFILLAVIPAVIFMNRTSGHLSIFSQKKSKGRLIAEEGAALAIQQLSKPGTPPPNWPYLGGTLPNSGTVQSTQGGTYTLAYIAAPDQRLQSYQVGVLTTPLDSAGKKIPGSSIFTTVSQRTTGVKMPTGQSASAALDLAKVPIVTNNTSVLRVEFGSIVVRDTNTWTLNPALDISKRPRKFSAGAIVPRVSNPNNEISSDQKEYWAYVSPGFAPVMDTVGYIAQAKAQTCSSAPTCAGVPCVPNPVGSCYFNVGASTAVFNNIVSQTVSASVDKIIYIDGNAEFDRYTANLASGAMVVGGNLTLGNNNQVSSGAPVTNVPIPLTVGAEDPYCTCSDPVCIGAVDRHIDIRAFLYVKGNLHVDRTAGNVADTNNWTVSGVARVDGQLTLDANTSLLVVYNDISSHKILTTNFELQIDSMTALP